MPFIYTNKRCGKCEIETMLEFESDEALLYFLSEAKEEAPNPVDVMVALIEQEGCTIIKPQFDAAREHLQEEMPAIRTALECFIEAIMAYEEKTGKRPKTATLSGALKSAIEGEIKKEISFDDDSMPTLYGVTIVPPSSLSDIHIAQ